MAARENHSYCCTTRKRPTYQADLMERDVGQAATTLPVEGRKEELKREGDDNEKPKLPEREFEALGTDDPKKKTAYEVITLDDEKMLKEMPFYHGYLARDDVHHVLRQEGDYLLRVSEVDGTDSGRQLVLSMMTSYIPTEKEERQVSIYNNNNQLKLRNVVVNRSNGQYRIDQTIGFPTVKELINHFSQHNYTTKVGSVRLKRGMPLLKWEYSHADLELYKLLGEGAFGEVREGLLKRKKKKPVRVAVKLGKGQSEATKEKVREMMKEARIQNSLKHRNVVRLYGVLALEQPIGIILELVDGGSLDAYLKTGEGMIDTREKIGMCTGAANGLAYIHSLRIIHRDIAARNCLYNGKDKLVKISDFGLSKRLSERVDSEYKMRKAVKLPIKWLAPETIKDHVFTFKTDVYSYGVLLFEIFANGKEPWEELGNQETKKKVTSGEFLTLPEECPLKLREFVQTKIYVLDKQKRVSMYDIVRFMESLLTESKMAEFQADLSCYRTQKTQRTDIVRSASKEVMEETGAASSGSRTPSGPSAEPGQNRKPPASPRKKETKKPKVVGPHLGPKKFKNK